MYRQIVCAWKMVLLFKSSRFSGPTDSFPGSVFIGRITSSLKLELEHALARTTCDVFKIAYM